MGSLLVVGRRSWCLCAEQFNYEDRCAEGINNHYQTVTTIEMNQRSYLYQAPALSIETLPELILLKLRCHSGCCVICHNWDDWWHLRDALLDVVATSTVSVVCELGQLTAIIPLERWANCDLHNIQSVRRLVQCAARISRLNSSSVFSGPFNCSDLAFRRSLEKSIVFYWAVINLRTSFNHLVCFAKYPS